MRIPALAVLCAALASTAQADEVHGIWQSEAGDTGSFILVEIAPCATDAAKLCGIIIDTGNVVPANADPKRREELVGKFVIRDMEPDGAGEWDNGTIWAPDDDKTYDSKMQLKDGTLEVSGCVLAGLICRGQDWTRVK